MLLRAYRVSDRVGIVLIKSSAGLTTLILNRILLLRQTAGGAISRILGWIIGLAALLIGILAWVLGHLRRLLFAVFNVVLNLVYRATGQTTQAARTSTSRAMARRSTRAKVEAEVIEDPLRLQNRTLSALLVMILLVLIAVVIWATGNNAKPTSTGVPVADSLNAGLNPVTPQDNSDPPSLNLATPVPTATNLPDVLQIRGSLAFVKREMGQTDLWVAPVDSRTQLRITNSPGDERDPAWSPDGTRLAYAANSNQDNEDKNWEIYIYDLNRNETERMTFNLAFEAAPQWSPDGQYLVYESYQSDTHLDIFVMPSDGSDVPTAIASSSAPDFSPAWDPSGSGRRIAFVSWRDGNRDIYIFDLDSGEVTNFTNTPNLHEDEPAWSPDGDYLAYSAVDAGIETIFVKSTRNISSPAEAFRQGKTPSWSPDGTSIVYAVDSTDGGRIIVSPFVESGVTTEVIQVPRGSHSPVWTSSPLPASLLSSGGLEPGITEPLFDEQVSTDSAPYGLGSLVNITSLDSTAVLSELVNDSFNALRERTNEEAGWDFLNNLSDAFWQLDDRPPAGVPARNWHKTGRAFAFNRNQILGFPAPVEIVREDTDLQTYWRVYVRVSNNAQNGELGEPLRDMPWDFVGPEDGDVEAYERGGRLYPAMPSGYYIDFTQIAEDYGWLRSAASSDWRNNVNGRNYWLFLKTEGLNWYDAMRQLYSEGQLINFAPTPTPAPTEIEDAEEETEST